MIISGSSRRGRSGGGAGVEGASARSQPRHRRPPQSHRDPSKGNQGRGEKTRDSTVAMAVRPFRFVLIYEVRDGPRWQLFSDVRFR